MIHPDYQGQDFFLGLFRESLRIIIASGARHMLVDCRDELLSTYLSFGMTQMGVRVPRKIGGEEFYVNFLHMDLEKLVLKRKANLILWNEVALPIMVDLVGSGLLPKGVYNRWLILSGKMSLPFTRFLYTLKVKRKSKQRMLDKRK